MISLDIEASGLDSGRCGIWQIGALEIENPKNNFLEEARIDDEDEIIEEALKVIGKTKEYLRNSDKQSQKQLIEHFLKWVKTCKPPRILVGQNIGWDVSFIQNKCMRYGIMDKFRYSIGQRAIDTHTLAQIRYKEKNKEYLIKEEKSGMNLSSVLELCGLEDDRIRLEMGKIVKKGKPHNSLEDAKLTAECYRRLIR